MKSAVDEYEGIAENVTVMASEGGARSPLTGDTDIADPAVRVRPMIDR